MVFPQMPNFFPPKTVIAHSKKLIPIARVFPDRTAPSQKRASLPKNSLSSFHQFLTVFCFYENFSSIKTSPHKYLRKGEKLHKNLHKTKKNSYSTPYCNKNLHIV